MPDTATAAYLERYKARESFVGDDGRTYVLRPLRPSQLFKARDMCVGADPATFNVIAGVASICEIDGDPISFPTVRQEAESVLDRVGFNSLKVLSEAFAKLNASEDEKGGKAAAVADAA